MEREVSYAHKELIHRIALLRRDEAAFLETLRGYARFMEYNVVWWEGQPKPVAFPRENEIREYCDKHSNTMVERMMFLLELYDVRLRTRCVFMSQSQHHIHLLFDRSMTYWAYLDDEIRLRLSVLTSDLCSADYFVPLSGVTFTKFHQVDFRPIQSISMALETLITSTLAFVRSQLMGENLGEDLFR